MTGGLAEDLTAADFPPPQPLAAFWVHSKDAPRTVPKIKLKEWTRRHEQEAKRECEAQAPLQGPLMAVL